MIAETIADGVDLATLHAGMFNCFDAIDEEDTGDADLIEDKPRKAPETGFDGTGYGSDTFVTPEPAKKNEVVKKKAANDNREPLEEYTTGERRIDLLTRTYEPSGFDRNTMTFSHPSDFDMDTQTVKREGRAGRVDPRPQWTPPTAANDNQKRKHSFPALDEARNSTLMVGRDRADTLIQNEWAFDILLEVKDLIEAATPKTAWLQHDGHGETDEHAIEDNPNPGYGIDAKHDYGPSVKKVKRLWEHGNDNEPSKKGEPWNQGTVELMDVISEPSNKIVKALRHVGGLQMNDSNNVTHFRDKKGKYLKFKTKTRGAKGKRETRPDPRDTPKYDGAALPRNKKNELTAGFVAGKIGSSNSMKPDTLAYAPEARPTHSANDPWAAQMAADHARDEATIKLSQYRFLVGDKPYDALFQAASGFRIGELCGGRLGNTTDSARGRSFLRFAIERIIEEHSRSKAAT